MAATAVNTFFEKSLMESDVRIPRYNKETEEAMQEARDITSDKVLAKSYSSSKELFAELDEE